MTDSLPARGASIEAFTNRIFWADAMDLLAALPDKSIDMVLVDLPYGVTACAWDTVIPFVPMWEGLRRVVKKKTAIVMTATQPFTSALVSSNYEWYRSHWVWDKKRAVGFQISKHRQLMQHEDVIVFGYPSVNYYPQLIKRDKPKFGGTYSGSSLLTNALIPKGENPNFEFPRSILEFSNADQNDKDHPTQKPVALFEYLIKTYTKEGEIVLDFCSGSGTTAIACTNLDRRFICCDLHEPYVIASRERLARHDPMQNSPLKNGMVQKSLWSK